MNDADAGTGDRSAARWAVLRHALPDGSHHFDLLIQPPGADPLARVPTFRCPHQPGGVGPGADQRVEVLGDHRAVYLWYEGPVSSGRGQVRRVAGGAVAASGGGMEAPDGWRLRLEHEAGGAAWAVTIEAEGGGWARVRIREMGLGEAGALC